MLMLCLCLCLCLFASENRPKHNKLSTPYIPKGTMVTASNSSQTVTRNSSRFKFIPKHFALSQENDVKRDDEKTPAIQQNLRPKNRVCQDDPKDLSNLLLDFLTMYKSSMANRLKQGTFLIHLFISVNKVEIYETFIIELCLSNSEHCCYFKCYL